jgi:hypothetical protein
VSDEEPARGVPPWRAGLAIALVALSVGGAAWIATRPLPESLPRVPPERVPFEVEEGEPEPGGPQSSELARPPAPDAETAIADRPVPAPSSEPGDEGDVEQPPPSSDRSLRDTIERQLTMNGLGGVEVEVDGDRVVTSGSLASARDQMRLVLIVEALAPERRHEDRTRVAGHESR